MRVNGIIILKWILEKYGIKFCDVFRCGPIAGSFERL
jgi:hypothetical protein